MDYTVSPGKIAYGILFTALLLTTVCFGDVPNSDPVRPGREFVYVATSYHISQFRIGMDGTLIPLLPPMAPIQNSSGYDGGPISLSIDKGQRFVYVPYLEADRKKIQSALLPGTPNSHPLDFLKPMILQYRVSSSGALEPLSPARIDAGENLTFMNPKSELLFGRAGRFAYFVDDGVRKGGTRPGRIGAIIARYQIMGDGTLQALSPYLISEKYGDPVLKIDHSGCYAYVYDGATQIKENTSEATISQYRIMLDGSIVPLQPAVIHLGRIAIWDLILHPDGRSIYAICSKWDGKDEDEECVMQLHVGSDGGLTPLVPAEAPIGAYGTSFVIAPNGQNSYTIGGKDGLQIDQYRISPLGELSPLASIKIPSATPGASVTLDPAGHFAYVVSQDDGVIHQFQIGAQGALTALKQKKVDTGTLPNILYIDPQTHFLCLSNLHGGDLALYRINGGALAPAKPGTLNTDTAPVSVAFVLR